MLDSCGNEYSIFDIYQDWFHQLTLKTAKHVAHQFCMLDMAKDGMIVLIISTVKCIDESEDDTLLFVLSRFVMSNYGFKIYRAKFGQILMFLWTSWSYRKL